MKIPHFYGFCYHPAISTWFTRGICVCAEEHLTDSQLPQMWWSQVDQYHTRFKSVFEEYRHAKTSHHHSSSSVTFMENSSIYFQDQCPLFFLIVHSLGVGGVSTGSHNPQSISPPLLPPLETLSRDTKAGWKLRETSSNVFWHTFYSLHLFSSSLIWVH